MGEGNTAGGSLELAGLIDRHGEFLAPDLKHWFDIDLRDLFSEDDPLEPSWVMMHVRCLPMSSRFMAELRGGERFIGWDEGRYMQAALIDSIRVLQYIMVLVNSDPKKKAASPPDPYPLPDQLRVKQQQQQDKPGSFAFIANAQLAKIKQIKELKKGGVDGWR